MRTTPLHLLPSPFPLRAGLTLAEVLISMGILVVGLLGVASLFPVGGHYMQQGDIADRAGAIAQAALDDAIVRGHLNPGNWFCLDIDLVKNGANGILPSSVVEALRDGIVRSKSNQDGGLGNRYLNGFYGATYVIDPLGMAAVLEEGLPAYQTLSPPNRIWQGTTESSRVRRFPATDSDIPLSWSPWSLQQPGFATWPIRRVSTTIDPNRFNNTSYKFQSPAAKKLFTTSDDLALIMPGNGDDPTRGRWATWSNGSAPLAAARQSRGDYSWIVSVSPGSSEARDALATQPDAYQYDVSVVVFYKRVLGHGYAGALEAERLVQAKVVSTGTAGGELLLERFYPSSPPVGLPSGAADEPNLSPFEDLRAGEYIMLTGPHPHSTDNRPMLFSQWYRVVTIEDSGRSILDGTTTEQQLNRESRVLVSLRGPDWPWQPATSQSGADLSDNVLSNDLRVTIIPGAVAVHTKTMRLESGSAWGNE